MQGDRDDRTREWATAIMAAATFHQLVDDAAEIAELLVEPRPLPPAGTVSMARLYRLVVSEREANHRLRCRLRAALLVGPDG